MMVAFWPPIMLTQEQAVEIKVMARRGVSIREMAKQLGCSREAANLFFNVVAQRYERTSIIVTSNLPFSQ